MPPWPGIISPKSLILNALLNPEQVFRCESISITDRFPQPFSDTPVSWTVTCRVVPHLKILLELVQSIGAFLMCQLLFGINSVYSITNPKSRNAANRRAKNKTTPFRRNVGVWFDRLRLNTHFFSFLIGRPNSFRIKDSPEAKKPPKGPMMDAKRDMKRACIMKGYRVTVS